MVKTKKQVLTKMAIDIKKDIEKLFLYSRVTKYQKDKASLNNAAFRLNDALIKITDINVRIKNGTKVFLKEDG